MSLDKYQSILGAVVCTIAVVAVAALVVAIIAVLCKDLWDSYKK